MSMTSAVEMRSQVVSPVSIFMGGRYSRDPVRTVPRRRRVGRGSVPAARALRYSVETV